jgi:hypothetical protein
MWTAVDHFVGSPVSRAKLEANEAEGREAQIRKVLELDKEHAREWIKNPQGKPLAMLRLEYQDNLTDSIKCISLYRSHASSIRRA